MAQPIGELIILSGLVSSAVSVAAFLYSHWAPRRILIARCFYGVMCLATVAASALLAWALITRDFSVRYVAAHTSRDLSLFYTISAFWAGQEGSFLFWILCAAFLGLLVQRSLRRYQALFMTVFSSQIFALYLLLQHSGMFSIFSPVPADGTGLNPLLINFWMAIHPPLMFLGYAAAGIPYAFAVVALFLAAEERWHSRALPWSVAAWVLLGLGIGLGAYWSYETLGWGGYWAWDPVENASLIPWLLLTALIHSQARVSKYRVGAIGSYSLSILIFISVLYGTFLTRSGILAEFSVHAFTDLGLSSGLVGTIAVFASLPIVAFAAGRARRQPSQARARGAVVPRDLFLLLACLILTLSAVMTAGGTSSPLITSLFSENPSQVQIPFYIQTNLPLALLVLLLLAAVPFYTWGQAAWPPQRWQALLVSAAGALVLTPLIGLSAVSPAHPHGITSPKHLMLVMIACWAAVAAACSIALRLEGKTWGTLGQPVAHLGFALLMLGSITATGYDWSAQGDLPEGEIANVGPFTCEYLGDVETSGERWVMRTWIRSLRGRAWIAEPVLWIDARRGQLMASPSIIRGIWRDVYVTPIEYRSPEPGGYRDAELAKNETSDIGNCAITFRGFTFPEHEDTESEAITVAAEIEIGYENQAYVIRPLYIVAPGAEPESPPAAVGQTGLSVTVMGLNASAGTILVRISGLAAAVSPEPAVFTVQISVKPLISMVWLGMILLVTGGTIGVAQRFSRRR